MSYVKYKKNYCLDKCLLHVYRLTFSRTTAPGITGESRLQICQVASFTRDYLYSELRLQLQECTCDGFGTPQWAQMPSEQLGVKSCELLLLLHSSVEKFLCFSVPTKKQGQLTRLLPQQTTWPCCMDGRAVPEAECRAVTCKASGAAWREAEPSMQWGWAKSRDLSSHCSASHPL